MRILIVEDEPDHRRLLSLILKDHEVIEAGDGAEAIELARCHYPDAILMDVQMPVMDGFTALEKLKADGATALIPVVLISAAYTREKDIQRGRELGAASHVKKPFDIGELREKLKNCAKKKAWDRTQAHETPF